MDEQRFTAILEAMSSSDNDNRKGAEAAFEEAKKTSGQWILNALVSIVSGPAPEPIHSMSLSVLRRMFFKKEKFYEMEPPQSQADIRSRMLVAFGNLCPVSNPLNRQVAACVAALAAKVYSLDQSWNELWGSLFQALNDNNASPAIRAGSCEVLSQCSLELRNYLPNHYSELHSGIVMCFQSNNMEVRKGASKAISDVIPTVQLKHRQPFRDLPILFLQSIQDTLNQGQQEDAVTLLSDLCTLVESTPDLFKTSLTPVLEAMMQIAASPLVGPRAVAIEAMNLMVTSNTKAVKKVDGFCRSFIELLFNNMLSPVIPDNWDVTASDEAEDIEEDDDFHIAATSLDQVVSALGDKYIAPYIQQLVAENISHEDWHRRHAAIMLVTYTGEGLRDSFLAHMEFVIRTVASQANDSNKVVRFAVYQCLNQLSNDFAPDLQSKLHGIVLPVLINGCAEEIPRLQHVSLGGIASFVDEAEPGEDDADFVAKLLAPYIDRLMEAVSTCAANSQFHYVKEMSLRALASIIAVSKQNVVPYIAKIVPFCQSILALNEDVPDKKQVRMLKCCAIECTTLVASAVGYQHFSEYAHPVCQFLCDLMSQNLDSDDERLGYCLRGWTNMVDCLGANVLPYLPCVIPSLLKLALLDCDIEIADYNVGEDEDEEEEEEKDGVKKGTVEKVLMSINNKEVVVKFKSDQIEDKRSAVNILYEILRGLKGNMRDYFTQIEEVANNCLEFCANGSIRSRGAELMVEMIDSIQEAYPQELNNFATRCIDSLLKCVATEREFSLLGDFLKAFSRFLPLVQETLSQETVHTFSLLLSEIVKESIKRRNQLLASREENPEDLDEEDLEDLEAAVESEEMLVDSDVSLMVEALLKTFPIYTPMFEAEFLPIIGNMLANNIDSDKHTAMMYLGIFIDNCANNAAANHLADFCPVFLNTTDSDSDLIAHHAFNGLRAILNLCARSYNQPHEGSLDFANSAVDKIKRFLNGQRCRKEEFGGARNNACSAGMSFIEFFGEYSTSNAAEVLRSIVACVPLNDEDEVEAKNVHRKLVQMVAGQHPLTADLAAAIIGKVKGANADCLDDDTKNALSNM